MTNVHTLGVFLVLAALSLSGCGAAVNSGFRNAAAPIASTTRFEADRFAGDWHVVARIAAPDAVAGAAPERFAFETAVGGFAVRRQWRDCAAGACTDQDETERATLTGAGRFEMRRRGRMAEHWVLWVDDDYRVAAIGTPNGRFGWIMARSPSPRADLVAAARDILQWQGYDMTKLRKVSQ